MQMRTLGKTGKQVGVIGFGAWGIGGQWGPVSESEATCTIEAALDAGMTFFDTADAYGEPMGLSEERMGRVLRPFRDRVQIATKVGNWGRRHGHPLTYTHWCHVQGCCDASLHRMGIDIIDLYQCHIGTPAPAEAEVFLEAFDRLVEQGKIRAFGLSTHSVEACEAFNRAGKLAAVQLDYSLLNRRHEGDLLPWCAKHDVGVVVRGPLAQGVCTGKFTPESRFSDSVRQSWNEGEGRARLLKRIEAVEQLRFLEQGGRSMTQAALQFVVSHPAVTVAIPGAKTPEQAKQNAKAGDAALTEAELEHVRATLARCGV